MALSIPWLDQQIAQGNPNDTFQGSSAPIYVPPAGMETNVLQGLKAPELSAQDVAAVTPRVPRDRHSFLDVLGGVADTLASVGGAAPLYQAGLDAQDARARQVDLDQMRQQQFDMQQRQGEQTLASGQQQLAGGEREQVGQALSGVIGAENPAEAWAQIADTANISPARKAQIAQALASGVAPDKLAQAFGYAPAAQGSLPSSIQNYALYQKILTEQGPDAAKAFLQFAQPNSQLTPYQQAQLGLAGRKQGFEEYKYANPQQKPGGAEAGGASDVAQILNDFNIQLNGKTDPVADLIRNSTSGRLEAAAALIPSAFGRSTKGQENIGRLETINNALVLALAGGKLGAGVSNADRDFFKEMSGKISDPSIAIGQRLAAWGQIKSRLRGIQQRASQPSSAGQRQTKPGVVNPGLEAEMRRRGLLR